MKRILFINQAASRLKREIEKAKELKKMVYGIKIKLLSEE